MYYYEEASMRGKWKPVTAPLPPRIRNGRVRFVDSIGPRVRALKKIDPGHRHLTLDQLRECYSPDGKFFRSTAATNPAY